MFTSGDKIGTYSMIDYIGEGGMGFVIKVINEKDGQSYALKYCKENDEKSIKRFKREVRIASETKHQNIIDVTFYDLENEPPYFVMPLARGSVHDVIKQVAGDFTKVLKVFEQMCKGISALHNSGKFHRDIKPRNALILDNGIIAIADFGLAKLEIKDSSTHTSSNDFLGTWGYHAPEQINAKDSDARTDVFQLGKCFYEIFTGEYPYLINTKRIPAGLAYIIQKATSHEPDDRYQTVGGLLQAIKSYEKSLNPNENPRDALDNKLLEIKKILEIGHYNEELCIGLTDLLGNNVENTKLFVEYFHKIPNPILQIFSNQLKDRFGPLFERYTEKLAIYISDNYLDFSFAEIVASKMSVIFSSTKNINFKGIAIRNTLKVAIWFNRYNAMDTFNSLLQQVRANDEAAFIAQILLEEIELYSKIADQSDDNTLHGVIIEVKKQALKYKKSEQENNDSDNDFLNNLFFVA